MNRAWLAIPVVLLAGCQTSLPIPGLGSKTTDQEKIATILDNVQHGVETGKVDRVMAHVSGRYRDAQGRDYAAMRDYLAFIRHSYRDIQITRSSPRIVVEGDQARALEAFGTIAEPADPAVAPPLNIQGQVTVSFVREEVEWKILEWG